MTTDALNSDQFGAQLLVQQLHDTARSDFDFVLHRTIEETNE